MKIVSNIDKIPFKDMLPEERSILANAWMEDKLEAFIDGYGWQSVDNTDCLSPMVTYRTKPKQLVIPWEHIKSEYNWAAMDINGDVYLYTTCPELYETAGCWRGWWKYCSTILRIETNGINWQNSLVQRPEGV